MSVNSAIASVTQARSKSGKVSGDAETEGTEFWGRMELDGERIIYLEITAISSAIWLACSKTKEIAFS